jgi:hypothetical protein
LQKKIQKSEKKLKKESKNAVKKGSAKLTERVKNQKNTE